MLEFLTFLKLTHDSQGRGIGGHWVSVFLDDGDDWKNHLDLQTSEQIAGCVD